MNAIRRDEEMDNLPPFMWTSGTGKRSSPGRSELVNILKQTVQKIVDAVRHAG